MGTSILNKKREGAFKMKKRTIRKTSLLTIILAFFLVLPAFNVSENNHQAVAQDITDEEVSDDIYTGHHWNHNVMNIGQAWEDGYTGEGVTIGILDTGFFQDHPDLTMVGGDSVFADDPWSNDHSGHGTHVAGIIGAHEESTYQGVAPGADLFGIKIYHEDDVNEDGAVSTDTNSVTNGIARAIENDADIILISSGVDYHDEDLYQQIQEAYAQDIMIIAASGNGNATVNYPANYEEVIAVTAVNEQLQPATDIIYGQENDFAAPGVNIGGLSIPDSAYSYPYIFMSGSSQAAPHAAGLAAILMEKHGGRGDDIRQIMEQQAQNIGDSGLFGHGLLRYVSDEQEAAAPMPPPEEDADEAADDTTPPENDEAPDDAEEELAVREPTSSRTADGEDDTALAYHQTEAIQQADGNYIEDEIVPLVETGGTLEIWLGTLENVTLNEDQISEIRERNLTLVLARDNVTWTIPPANILPGEAILHFYEGVPTDITPIEGESTNIYTTEIEQEDANLLTYPGWMEMQFDFSQEDLDNFSDLNGYYWDPEEEEWLETDSEVEDETFILRTRHASSLGIFDPELIAAEATNENNEEQQATAESETDSLSDLSLSTQIIIGLIVFIVLLIGIRLILRKRK